jgi:trimethylamine--corrinoid protein Co-methyltransferase
MLFNVKMLTDEQIENIHSQSMEVLGKRGISIYHEPTRKLLIDHGAVPGEGDIIKIPKQLFEERIKLAPKTFEIKARDPKKSITIGNGQTYLAPTGGPVFVHDHINSRRKGKLSNVIDFFRLAHTSDQVEAVCAGLLDPSDIKEEYKHLVLMKELLHNTDKVVMGLSTGGEVAKHSIEMAKIVLDPDNKEHFIFGIINTLSPLAYDQRMLEALWVYSEHNQPLVVTCCSMAGFTSPVSLWATIVQNNVEVITGLLIAQLINPGCPVIYGNTSTITDMRTMNLCIGAPEFSIFTSAFKQLADYYGVPYRGGGSLTDGKVVDVQTGIEATINLYTTLGSKVDIVLHGLGVMESFLTVSYEKWIWDEEIIGRIRRMLEGVKPMEADESISVASDVKAGGHYLEHPNTYANFRTEFFNPTISDRNNWSTWEENNKSAIENAYEKAQQRLKDFKEPQLSENSIKNLEIYLKDKLPKEFV